MTFIKVTSSVGLCSSMIDDEGSIEICIESCNENVVNVFTKLDPLSVGYSISNLSGNTITAMNMLNFVTICV